MFRNKAVLSNTVSKLERRINELGDQMEEEHRIATEQKDLVRHQHTFSHTPSQEVQQNQQLIIKIINTLEKVRKKSLQSSMTP